jgi:hypothetical protein
MVKIDLFSRSINLPIRTYSSRSDIERSSPSKRVVKRWDKVWEGTRDDEGGNIGERS